MRTSGAHPNPVDEVHIDVAYGYPVPPPPPISTARAYGYGYPAEPPPSTGHPISARHWWCRAIAILVGLVSLAVALIILFIVTTDEKPARFQLESVSVDNSTAVWNIGFSLDKPVGDLDVWIRFLSRDFKAEAVGSAGRATVSLSTAPLPQGYSFPAEVTLEQVMFRCNNYQLNAMQAACKDVTVVVSSNGVMKGGPRFCPKVHPYD